MLVPNRHGSSNSYRYGFQGQEKDDELKGEGNSLNYTFRMHDPRVGRFFAIDPLTHKYPWYTPYSFSGNKVIAFTELEGAEEKIAIYDSKYKSWKYFSRNDWGLEEDWTNYRTAWLKAISREYKSGTSVAYGYEQYTSNTSNGQIVIPETGMLMIDLSGSYPVYEFSDVDKPKVVNKPKSSTLDIIMGAFDEKTNPEMVKGINTMKNYVAGVSAVISAPAVVTGEAGVVGTFGLISDIDQLTGASSKITENSPNASTTVNAVKVAVDVISIKNNINDVLKFNHVKTADATLTFSETITGSANTSGDVQELQDGVKNN